MRYAWMTMAVVALVSLACGGMGTPPPPPPAVGPQRPAPSEIVEAPPRPERVELHPGDILAVGDEADPIVVLVYTDWQCSHCERAWPQVVALAEERDDVQLRYRSFPLAAPCNPEVSVVDPNRCALAKAALCAAEEDAFLDYAPQAFAHPRSVLSTTAWSGQVMTACMADPAMDTVLAEHIALAEVLGVRGTPTFFVRRDDLWFGPLSIDEVEAAVDGRAAEAL